METIKNALAKFFGVIARGQTYLNAIYLLLAFPLGIFYFVFLVVGLTLGVSLIIVWVGLLILAAVFAIWYALAAFERQMAIGLLREDIPPMAHEDLTGKSLWQNFAAAVRNPVTWKGLVYLFAKFPLGILSFVVVVTLGSISLALLLTPLYYHLVDPYMAIMWNFRTGQPMWIIDTLNEALILSLAGFFLTLISLHVFNGLAWVSGKFARYMLGNFSEPVAPVNGTPATVTLDAIIPATAAPAALESETAAPIGTAANQ